MIQALFDSKLLLMFLVLAGIIVIVLLSIFIVQIFKANDGIFQILAGIKQALEGIQQTIKLISTTDHEDAARENQTAQQNQIIEQQRFLIVKDTNRSINTSLAELQQNLTNFIEESIDRSKVAAKERDIIQNQIINNTNNIVNEIQDLKDFLKIK